MIIVISPHPDDCLIGCYSLIKEKRIDAVLYIDPSPSRFALARAAGKALGFTVGLLEFGNLYNYLQKNPSCTFLVPDASDNHILHKAVNGVARLSGCKLGYYSTDMVASFIRELPIEEQQEKLSALNMYYPDQSSLWERDWKYFLFEGVVLEL